MKVQTRLRIIQALEIQANFYLFELGDHLATLGGVTIQVSYGTPNIPYDMIFMPYRVVFKEITIYNMDIFLE